jgi:rhamnosyltransferase subunit B
MTSTSDPAARPIAIISAPGSRGDVNPMIAIGRALVALGFDCSISLAEPYAPLAEKAGLRPEVLISRERFDLLLADPSVWEPLSGLRHVLRGAASDFLRPHLDVIFKRKRPGRTVLVSHPLDFASRIHRDYDPQTPVADVVLSPAMVRDPKDPPVLTPWWFEPRRPSWLISLGYRIGDLFILDRYLGDAVNRTRRDLGLDPVQRIMHRWWLSPDTVLALYPDWFGASRPIGGGVWRQCGFPLAVNSAGMAAEDRQRLEEHRSSHEGVRGRSVFFTPGTAHRHAQAFFELGIAVCEELGRPAIFATSHQDQIPQGLPPWVLPIGYVPLDQVLPHCAALVHHGGIGTTAAGLASGCPQVVTPMAFDQFHNASRLQQLGVGCTLYRPKLQALLAGLRGLIDQPRVDEKCRSLADRLSREEDGAEVAARQIAGLLHRDACPARTER